MIQPVEGMSVLAHCRRVVNPYDGWSNRFTHSERR